MRFHYFYGMLEGNIHVGSQILRQNTSISPLRAAV